VRGYRHTTCISVNDQVVHGIPGSRVLQPGDIVSIDAGAQFHGWNGDSAITVVVPDPSAAAVGRASDALRCHRGIALGGDRRAGVGEAPGRDRRASRTTSSPQVGARELHGILREYVGHGIGRKMHEARPVQLPHPDRGAEVRPGLVLAIEPMVTAGSDKTFVEDDDWTVTTTDGSTARTGSTASRCTTAASGC
jgi:methionyl aminopeptidase